MARRPVRKRPPFCPGQVGHFTTTSGRTQCTLESLSGEPKRLSRWRFGKWHPRHLQRRQHFRQAVPAQNSGNTEKDYRFSRYGHTVVTMIALLSAVGSLLSFRVRSRASLELELVALRHQLTVLRRQRPGRPRLFSADRLLWVWLYRIWPQVLDAMVLVKPATVIQWHRKGFRLYWQRRDGPRCTWSSAP